MANTTVLLADDDAAVRQILRKELEAHGCDVIEAKDGDEAIELLASAADGTGVQPDVVLMDVMMPGCSGLGVLDVTRRFARRPTTLLMTGFRDASVDILARKLGATRVFHKPLDLEELLDGVLAVAKGAHLRGTPSATR